MGGDGTAVFASVHVFAFAAYVCVHHSIILARYAK